jgi:phospholipase C
LPGVIDHVFVLVLENRSFDHMLGFSGIAGTDAVTGSPTSVNGLALAGVSLLQLARSWQEHTVSGIVVRQGGTWPPPPAISIRALLDSGMSNTFDGQSYKAMQPADYAMPVDPGHEFPDVVMQLGGPGAAYPFGGAYPRVLNSGFVASYAASGGEVNPAEIMKCYQGGQLALQGSQLPVLNQLAKEFAVCDSWHAAMPGPTWPNRFFVHAGSSGGLDHSPSAVEMATWETVDGFSFKNGTIFDRMSGKDLQWRLYAGDDLPITAALKGIQLSEIHPYHEFASDVAQVGYPVSYTFIEPSYGHILTDYKCGTSQHPLDDVTRGESLIKCTYEAIRNSPLWNSSLLVITWDEHGGFYDHVPPPGAVAPGDTHPGDQYNQYGFTFEQCGARVPAVVISPLIPPNLIDHRRYDHTSILATLEALFGLDPMTQRDAEANSLTPLLSLSAPRGDAPTVLEPPADSQVGGCSPFSCSDPPATEPLPPSRPHDSINEGNLPGFLYTALRWDVALSPPEQRPAAIARFRALETRADAWRYLNQVRQMISAAKDRPSSISPGPN